MAYLAQCVPLYSLFRQTLPVICPRPSFCILLPRTWSLMRRIGARVSCDQAGVWLTWSSREAGLHFVRCTPSGCRAGSWAIPGISAESAHVAELGDKVFLVASRLAPSSAIVLRTGAIDRMASAAERCIAEGAWAAASLAQRDVMLVVARGDDAAGKVGAFRVDVSERVESLIAAP